MGLQTRREKEKEHAINTGKEKTVVSHTVIGYNRKNEERQEKDKRWQQGQLNNDNDSKAVTITSTQLHESRSSRQKCKA